MKVLVGAPIHESKDYSIPRWLANVSGLQKNSPFDLLMVDNTKGLEYFKKVEGYCQEQGIKNYKIEHFEITNADMEPDKARSVKVEISQELLRQAALKGNYDAWFSWECDQLIPQDSLSKLTNLMEKNKYMMIAVNSWARTMPGELNTNMGVTLISREALKMGWFLPFKEGKISFDVTDFYNVDETMFKKRLLAAGGNYIELFGVIDPVYHLDK